MAIKAKLEVDNTELKKGLKDAEKQAKTSMDNIADAAQGASGGFRGMLGYLNKLGPVAKIAAASIAIIGTAVVAAVAGFKKLTDKLDLIHKEASGLDITTDELQSLQFAAQRSHIPFEKVIRLFGKVSENVNKVKDGSLETARAFTSLGISVKDLETQSPLENYLAVIEAIRRLPKDQSPDAALFKLFSSRDIKMMKQMANNNFDLIAKTAGFAGVVIDSKTIEGAAGLADSLGTVNMQVINSLTNLLKVKDVMAGIKKIADGIMAEFRNFETGGRSPFKNQIGIGDAIDRYEDELLKNPDSNTYSDLKAKLEERKKTLRLEILKNNGFSNDYILKNYDSLIKSLSDETERRIDNQARVEVLGPAAAKSEQFKDVFKNFDINDPTTWLVDKPKDWQDSQRVKNDFADYEATQYIKAYSKEVSKIKDNITDIKGETFDVEKAIEKIQKDTGGIISEEEAKKLREAAEELKKARDELAKATLDKETQDLEQSNKITQALIDGDLDRANKLQLINELKRMGINITEEELEKDQEKYKELQKQINLQKKLNLEKSLKDQGKSLYINAMKQAGFTKEAAYAEALMNAEKIKGARLTEDETERVKKMTDLQFQLNSLGKFSITDSGIQTNELTARGGFASGAAYTDKDTYNQQIRNYAAQQVKILNDIKQEIEDGGLT